MGQLEGFPPPKDTHTFVIEFGADQYDQTLFGVLESMFFASLPEGSFQQASRWNAELNATVVTVMTNSMLVAYLFEAVKKGRARELSAFLQSLERDELWGPIPAPASADT